MFGMPGVEKSLELQFKVLYGVRRYVKKICMMQNNFCTRQQIEHPPPPGFSILSPWVKKPQSCREITF